MSCRAQSRHLIKGFLNRHLVPHVEMTTKMIKFFRNIRKKLATEGKAIGYMRYAIGEIVLVVIGILIALQINNWNEQRKDNLKLKNYRKALIIELKKDQNEIQGFLKRAEKDRQVFDSQKERISKSTHPLDTVYYIARYEFVPFIPSFTLSNHTFQMLQSTGDLDLFDSEMVDQLYELYNGEDHYLSAIHETWNNYNDALTDYTKAFPLDVKMSMMTQGSINDTLWKHVNKLQLAYQFNAISIAKHNYLRVGLFTESFLQPLEEMIAKLELTETNKK